MFQTQTLKHAAVAVAASSPFTSGCWHPCIRPEVTSTARTFATMRTQQPGSLPDYQIDPYVILEDDLKDVYDYIRNVSWIEHTNCSIYYYLELLIHVYIFKNNFHSTISRYGKLLSWIRIYTFEGDIGDLEKYSLFKCEFSD